jgi:hypothetical protein
LRHAATTFAADGGSAGVGRYGSESKPKPIEIVMVATRPDLDRLDRKRFHVQNGRPA